MHVQNMSKTRVGSAKDVVKRGQEVWVKVISMQGQKISLSMRDVDQVSVRVLQRSPAPPAELQPQVCIAASSCETVPTSRDNSVPLSSIHICMRVTKCSIARAPLY